MEQPGEVQLRSSSADGLRENQMSKNHNQAEVFALVFPGFPRDFPGWGYFPAEGTRHPRTAPAERQHPLPNPERWREKNVNYESK